MKKIIILFLLSSFIACNKPQGNRDGANVEQRNYVPTKPIDNAEIPSLKKVFDFKIKAGTLGNVLCNGDLTVIIGSQNTMDYQSDNIKCIGITIDIKRILKMNTSKTPKGSTSVVQGLYTGVVTRTVETSSLDAGTDTSAGLTVNYNPPIFLELPIPIQNPAEFVARFNSYPFSGTPIIATTDKGRRFEGRFHPQILAFNQSITLGQETFNSVIHYKRTISGFSGMPAYFKNAPPEIRFKEIEYKINTKPYRVLYLKRTGNGSDMLGDGIGGVIGGLVGDIVVEMNLKTYEEL